MGTKGTFYRIPEREEGRKLHRKDCESVDIKCIKTTLVTKKMECCCLQKFEEKKKFEEKLFLV